MIRLKHSAATGGLALLLLVATLLIAVAGAIASATSAVAEGFINTAQSGSIEVKTANDMTSLQNVPISIRGYCIATFDEEGTLSPTDDFVSLADVLATYDIAATENDAQAEALIEAATPVAQSLSRNPDITITITGKGVTEELVPGMYLLLPEDVAVADGIYAFMPLLVPVPYGEADSLIYEEVPAVLKGSLVPSNPDEPDESWGSVEIVKSLAAMDLSLGNPTFVFNVTATDESGTTLFSKVVALSFAEAGKKSVLLENIPLGATVTVTEVYSGASYVATTDTTQMVTVSADNPTASVTFENKPNDDRKGGSGIENAFTKGPDGWKLAQRTAESEEAA